MAWLERLEARAREWPRPVFWAYTAAKWYLVILGAILLIGWYFDKIRYFNSWFQ